MRRGRAVHVGGVPDGAGVGAVVLQGGVDQRDGGVSPGRSSQPANTTGKLALLGREGPRGEVEELEAEERMDRVTQHCSKCSDSVTAGTFQSEHSAVRTGNLLPSQ